VLQRLVSAHSSTSTVAMTTYRFAATRAASVSLLQTSYTQRHRLHRLRTRLMAALRRIRTVWTRRRRGTSRSANYGCRSVYIGRITRDRCIAATSSTVVASFKFRNTGSTWDTSSAVDCLLIVRNLTKSEIMSPHYDFRQHIHQYFKSKWQTIWDSQIDNKLPKMSPHIGVTYLGVNLIDAKGKYSTDYESVTLI